MTDTLAIHDMYERGEILRVSRYDLKDKDIIKIILGVYSLFAVFSLLASIIYIVCQK